MKSIRVISVRVVISLLGVGLFSPTVEAQSRIASPETFFGYQLGSDRNLPRWDRIVEYFQKLENEGGGKIKIVNMGPSTMGNPFLLVFISSPGNIARLEALRRVNARLSDPRGIPEQEIASLINEGRAVVCQSMSLHATEIGGTLMAPELACDLLVRQDPDTQRILDNVIFLMVPCFNPDGQIMVADWYQKTLGTQYEGTSPPWLYHKYAGHDNNRDAFQTNLVESQYMAKILFRDWVPQAYVDHHHMGSYGARIYVPPYAEPVRPFADPLTWRENSWYGAHIAYKEEEAGQSGVLNMAQYSGWGHFGFHWITPFHNIAGMLTESATTKLATPIFIHAHQLKGRTRGLPAYEEQTTFPAPWPGGWWRLRDIVERQKISAWAILDLAARNRETVLRNACLKARRQTERGASGKPAAYVIPAMQHDPLTAVKLVNKLLVQGIEVMLAPKGCSTAQGMTYPPGSFLVSLAQPKMGLIRYLLGRTLYPDNSYTRDRDGSPIRPYDMATDTMFEFMGVHVDPVNEPVNAELRKLAEPVPVAGKVTRGASGFVFDSRANDSFKALNLLLDKGISVRRVDRVTTGQQRGDFIVPAAPEALLSDIARLTGVDFGPVNGEIEQASHAVQRLRTGIYQGYGGGNMDEGWTRLLLEQFSFPYQTLMDAEIKKGGLNERFDVIILPNDSAANITGEKPEKPDAHDEPDEEYPPEYRSGIGKEGVESLKAFVQKGGTFIAFGEATDFAIAKLNLPIRNVLANKPAKEFFCPGSTLKVRFNASHPLASGMPPEGLVLFFNSPAFEILPNPFNERYEIIASYADQSILSSGWLIGEEKLAGKAGMMSAQFGEGKVILIGFRTQHRAQTHGTFKLLFNALVR